MIKLKIFFLIQVFLINYSCAQMITKEQQKQLEKIVAEFKAGGQKVYKLQSRKFKPKGIPFPQIPGPKCNDRIGIVGAGPSGVHMAYMLKKNGFKNVEILEKTNDIGGKSQALDYGAESQSLSSFLGNVNYNESVFPLFMELGLDPGLNRSYTVAFRTGNSFSDPVLQNLNVILASGPDRIIQELIRYTILHRQLFGRYQGELMNRPDQKTNEMLIGSYKDFMFRNNFKILYKRADLTQSFLGYSKLDDVGALQGLLWNTPEFYAGIYFSGTHAIKSKGSFKGLYKAMVKNQSLNIRYGYEVNHVVLNEDKTVNVSSLDQNAEPKTYDFLMWSGLTQEFAMKSDIGNMSEKEILASSKYYYVHTVLMDMENDIRAASSEAYLPSLGDPFRHTVAASVDFYAMENDIEGPNYANRNYTIDGEKAKTRTILSYIYGNDNPPKPHCELEKIAKEFYGSGFNATNMHAVRTSTFKYYPRWDTEKVNRGIIHDMFEIQGKYNIWFLGGGMSFDTVKSVVEYNDLLLRQTNKKRCSSKGRKPPQTRGHSAKKW